MSFRAAHGCHTVGRKGPPGLRSMEVEVKNVAELAAPLIGRPYISRAQAR